MMTEVIGAEYLVGLAIELDTSFDQDLELESIELVLLGELILARYGDQIDLGAWLATKELDEIISLTVGDLVSFIASSLSSTKDPVTRPR